MNSLQQLQATVHYMEYFLIFKQQVMLLAFQSGSFGVIQYIKNYRLQSCEKFSIIVNHASRENVSCFMTYSRGGQLLLHEFILKKLPKFCLFAEITICINVGFLLYIVGR